MYFINNFIFENFLNRTTVNFWTTKIWIVWVHLYAYFFQKIPVLFLIHDWESTDMKGWLYVLLYIITWGTWASSDHCIYTGVEGSSWNKDPIDTKEQHMFWGDSKVICRFSTEEKSAPQPHHCSRVNCILYNYIYNKSNLSNNKIIFQDNWYF